MDSDHILNGHQWKPFAQFGYVDSFWNINIDTIISTLVVLLFIIIISLIFSRMLKNETSTISFGILSYVRLFQGMLQETMNAAPLPYLSFIGSLFTFIAFCNIISIIPWLEEPTKDVNTTLALGIISFMYVQVASIRVGGWKSYIETYFHPFFLMLPLNIVGKLSSIVSLSFRLFGNIFGGCIILHLYNQLLSQSAILQTAGLFSGANVAMLFIFTIFDGLMQAFVFAMLALTYLSMEITPEEDDI